MDTIFLNIEPQDYEELDSLKRATMLKGIIQPQDKKKFPATFQHLEHSSRAKVRLKGDWTDHMDSDKWSLRVQLYDDHYKGMQRFSIQHPKTRGYLFEYEFHQLLREQGVLTTQYDFVYVVLNNQMQGVYALEEHFDTALLERSKRREGIIFKFDETAFWEFQDHIKKYGEDIHYEYPMFEAAKITAFRKGKINASPVLRKQYLHGRNLLHSFRDFNAQELSDQIDIEAFARYFALCDLVQKYHGLRWHNQRYYYDPLKQRLEPVAYDCWEPQSNLNRDFLGCPRANADTAYFPDVYLNMFLFNNAFFRQSYHQYLNDYVNDTAILETVQKISRRSDEVRSVLRGEFGNIPLFPLVDVIDKVPGRKMCDNDFDPEPIFTFFHYEKWKTAHPKQIKEYKTPLPTEPFSDLGLKAYIQGTDANSRRILLTNYHIEEIEVLRFSGTSQQPPTELRLRAYNYRDPDTIGFDVDTGAITVHYKIVGDSMEWKLPLSSWPYYRPIGVAQFNVDTSSLFHIVDTTLVINGDYYIDYPILIPEGYEVRIDAGTNLVFGPNGFFKSRSDIAVNGTQDAHVTFTAASGFKGIFLDECNFTATHSDFSDLSLVSGSNFTGILTMLDGKVVMKQCIFKDIVAEDALDIVRCNFTITDCNFQNCSSDALDVDFSSAFIENVTFNMIGNDGLDISAGHTLVEKCSFTDCGDKAISFGESANALAKSLVIQTAQIGVGCKDGSVIKITNSDISKCGLGVYAFRKKNYYNGSNVSLKQVSYKGNGKDQQQDIYSTITN